MADKYAGDNAAFPLETNDTRAIGLTKREWLVGMAMQGLAAGYASKSRLSQWPEEYFDELGAIAAKLADAALEAM